MTVDIGRKTTAQRVRKLIQSFEVLEPQMLTERRAKRVGVRDKRSSSSSTKVSAIHSLRYATRNLGKIVASALKGEPQIINKQEGKAVIVMSVETAHGLLAQTKKPRSLADMFPVDEAHPPLKRFPVRHRPGQSRLKA
jgi:tryptophanyl-tRNA synthetase